MSSAPAEDEVPARPSRLRRVVGLVSLAVVAAFLVLAVSRNWTSVREDIGALSPADWALSSFWALVGLVGSWGIWSTVLIGMGGHLGGHDSRAMFFTGQLGKYVPGSVWPAVIQARLGERHGIRQRTMLASYGYAVAISVATGGTVGVLALLALGTPVALLAAVGTAAVSATAFFVLLHPRGAERHLPRLAARFGRELVLRTPNARLKLTAVLISFATWCALGAHAWAIARVLGAGPGDVVVIIGGFALGFVAGILSLPVPGGAGIREAVIVLTFGSVVGRPGALTLALLSRFLLLVMDVVLAVAAGAIPLIRSARRWQRAGGDAGAGVDAGMGVDGSATAPEVGP